MTTGETDLEREYRTIREALIKGGLMTSNLDSLYSDWQRWRAEAKMPASDRPNSLALEVDQMVGPTPVAVPVPDGFSASGGSDRAGSQRRAGMIRTLSLADGVCLRPTREDVNDFIARRRRPCSHCWFA
jgi:hypothetical protein